MGETICAVAMSNGVRPTDYPTLRRTVFRMMEKRHVSNTTLEVLYLDETLLAVSKPANLPTMGVVNRPSLLTIARRCVERDDGPSAQPYLHVINRLDAPVTGVVLFARTPEVARRLTEQMHTGAVAKQYWALLDEPPEPHEAECVDWLRSDKRHRKVHVTHSAHPSAKEARLGYSMVAALPRATLVEIVLVTGRKHQIRVQMAHRDRPIVGDRKYGSGTLFDRGIALHARRLELTHPDRLHPLQLTAPVPTCWREWGDLDSLIG